MRDRDDKMHINLPPYYKEWFTLRHPNTPVPQAKGKIIVHLFNVYQGSVDADRQWNLLFTKVINQLGIYRSMRDLAVCSRKVDIVMVILNVSTDDVLVCTDFLVVRTKIENHLCKYFPITTKQGKVLEHLNYHITQSYSHVTVDQTDHIIKMTTAYFSKAPFKQTNTPFRTDRTVEDEIANAQP